MGTNNMNPNAYEMNAGGIQLLTTHDATETTIYTEELGYPVSVDLLLRVSAYDEGNGDVKIWRMSANLRKPGTGAPSIFGGLLDLVTPQTSNALGTVGWAVGLDISGNNMRVRVTGEAGRDIHWMMKFDGLQMSLS